MSSTLNTPISPEALERMHALWDALADYPPDKSEAALDHLLRELCAITDTSNAGWSASVRLRSRGRDDPLRGWRIRDTHYLHPTPNLERAVRKYAQNFELRRPDVISIRFYEEAGSFRVMRMADMVPPGWYDGEYYRWFFREGLGCTDGLRVGVPINDDLEAGFALMRDASRPAYTLADCALVATVIRGLRWFHRQQLAHRGVWLAEVPLTRTERSVLDLLLAGKTNKEIAAQQGHSTNTATEYVGRIYRKFGVKSRAELMALWLSRR